MRNRKGLVALAIASFVLGGLATAFHNSRAIIVEPPVKFTITTVTLAKATAGKPYNQQLEADNGMEPYTWSTTPGIDGALPNGLKLSSNGQINGTVGINVTAGTYTFTAIAKDSTKPTSKTAAKVLKLTVVAATGSNNSGNLAIDSSGLKDGTISVPYSGILKAINIPSDVVMLSWHMTDATYNNLTHGFGLRCETCQGQDSALPEIRIVGTPNHTGLVSGTFDLHGFKKTDLLPSYNTSINFQFYINLSGSNNNLAIDSSGLGVGTAGAPYSGNLVAKNAVNPHWALGNNNLSDFGLRADPTGAGDTFTITSINSTSAKQGTATGKITLTSQRTKDSGEDSITSDFTIKINSAGGGGGNTTYPTISAFTFDQGKKSITVTEGDSITFNWKVSNATSMQIIGRLTPQSATDPAGQKNICDEKGKDIYMSGKCELPTGSLKVNISRSSAFTLKATNTVAGKSRTSSASVYVIVRPKPVPAKQYGTLLMEGMLDGKSYSGRIVPSANGNGWKLTKDGTAQEGIGINSLPKVFNRATGKFNLQFVSDNKNFTLFDVLGRKIPATLDSIMPSGDMTLEVNKTVKFTISFKSSKVTPTPTPTPTVTPTSSVTPKPTPTPPGGSFDVSIGPVDCWIYKKGADNCAIKIGTPTGGIDPNEKMSYKILFKCHTDSKTSPKCVNSGDANIGNAVEGKCFIPSDKEYGVCNQIPFSEVPFSQLSSDKTHNGQPWTAYDRSNKSWPVYYFYLEATMNSTGKNITKTIRIPDHSSSMLDDSSVAESSGDEEVAAPNQELAVIGGTVTPNKSIITQTLDTMDSITLPIFYYAQKTFWNVIDMVMRKRPCYHDCFGGTPLPLPPKK